MKYAIISDACRVCLRKSATCRSIFIPLQAGEIAPNVKLNLVSGVNVAEKEIIKLPQLICKQCEISLNMAFHLRNRARKSDQILSLYCNQMNEDNIIVELDNGRKFKLSKELTLRVVPKNGSPRDLQSAAIPQSSNICKTEVDFEEIDVDDDSDDDGEDDAHNNDPDYDYDNHNDDDQHDDIIDMQSNSDSEEKFQNEESACLENDNEDSQEDENVSCDNDIEHYLKKKPTYNGEEIAKQLKASDRYELISWTQESTANAVPTFKLRLKDVDKEKNLSKDFICDICGNSYNQNHRLMEHMRRHNTEKNYACEICGKRFAVSEGLRRHILTHGAQKPYKCNFCTRCFYTPSARKAHEKVHSGAKPFVCKICSRGFAYTGSLRKHMLIHENKKLYRCEYCDKEFRLQHHMKQHQETQIHKDAVIEYEKAVKNEIVNG